MIVSSLDQLQIYINTRVNYHPNNPTAACWARERLTARALSLPDAAPHICTLWMVCSTCTIIELTHLSTSISAGLLSLSCAYIYAARESAGTLFSWSLSRSPQAIAGRGNNKAGVNNDSPSINTPIMLRRQIITAA